MDVPPLLPDPDPDADAELDGWLEALEAVFRRGVPHVAQSSSSGSMHVMARQTEHINANSVGLLWQKHEARNSTDFWDGWEKFVKNSSKEYAKNIFCVFSIIYNRNVRINILFSGHLYWND